MTKPPVKLSVSYNFLSTVCKHSNAVTYQNGLILTQSLPVGTILPNFVQTCENVKRVIKQKTNSYFILNSRRTVFWTIFNFSFLQIQIRKFKVFLRTTKSYSKTRDCIDLVT